MLTTLTSKGQMTLPKAVRDDLNLKAGDQIDIVKQGDSYVLRPRTKSVDDLYGILERQNDVALTVREMDDAIGEALAEDDERIRAGR